MSDSTLKFKTLEKWKANDLPCAICGMPLDWIKQHGVVVVDKMNCKQSLDLALSMDNLQVLCHLCNSRGVKYDPV